VPVFHIEPATEAHIPIVVLFVDVRKLSVAAVWLSPWGCWELSSAPSVWYHVGHWLGNCSGATHGICEWRVASTSTSAPALAAAYTAATTSRAKTRLSCKRLVHRYRNLRDGWHMECLTWHSCPCMGNHGRCHRHRCHLGHHGGLVGRQLVDSRGYLCTDCCALCCARATWCCRLCDGRDGVFVGLIPLLLVEYVVHCLV
jgi:hypothetical protein